MMTARSTMLRSSRTFPIEQVFAKGPVFDGLFQVAVRRGDDAHVDLAFSADSSPISSRKRVDWFAASKRPICRDSAPV
jgi:hypothetical protein